MNVIQEKFSTIIDEALRSEAGVHFPSNSVSYGVRDCLAHSQIRNQLKFNTIHGTGLIIPDRSPYAFLTPTVAYASTNSASSHTTYSR